MAAANPHVDLECPVCHEDFKVPKFLPCAHVICQRCVLSWLSTQGQGGCPLCRAPILPTTPPGQTGVISVVDSLPTDLATMALVESQQALNGDHLCGVCDGDVAATSYCLDCGIKLCKTCTKAHGRVPVSRDHLLEDLSTLTAERLAASRRSPCDSHHDKPAELYCRPHQSLICLLCATSKHRECRGVETVADMADHARSELREQARRLRNKEADIDEEIKRQEKEMKDAQAQFSATRAKAKFTCDRLQQTMEKRRQEISAKLQKEEDDFVKPKQEKKALLQEQKTSIAAHAGSVERLVVPSPDSALLGMLNKLKTRLSELETQTQPQVQVIPPARKHGRSGSENVLRLEQAVADFDHVTGINAPAVYMPYQQMEIEIGRLRALLEKKEKEIKLLKAIQERSRR